MKLPHEPDCRSACHIFLIGKFHFHAPIGAPCFYYISLTICIVTTKTFSQTFPNSVGDVSIGKVAATPPHNMIPTQDTNFSSTPSLYNHRKCAEDWNLWPLLLTLRVTKPVSPLLLAPHLQSSPVRILSCTDYLNCGQRGMRRGKDNRSAGRGWL